MDMETVESLTLLPRVKTQRLDRCRSTRKRCRGSSASRLTISRHNKSLIFIPFRQRPQITYLNPENAENQDGKDILQIGAHASSFSRFLSGANFFGNRERSSFMTTHSIAEPTRTKRNRHTSTIAAYTKNLIIAIPHTKSFR